jgi:hypothetical protein
MTKPDYIARGGDLVMAPPLELTSATMYSFLVGADYGALVDVCEKQLNAVTASVGVTYKPLLPFVAIVCADIAKSYSTTPPDSLKGWMAERDFGIWIPVVSSSGKIGWYLPYVFVDNVAAMVTGREVYGFFKQTATLAMPDSPGAAGDFSVDALVIEKYSPESTAQTIRLMTLTSTESLTAPDGEFTSARELVEGVWKDVKRLFYDTVADTKVLPVSIWDLIKNMLEELVTGDVPMIFLKQVRDATDPTKACYQAVIEAPAHLQKFERGWFTHPHDVTITPADSHPIVKECGLAGPTVRSELGFWCQMQFVMQPGKVIAEHT